MSMPDAAGERWIVISKWDEFQHPDALRTGNIPWIKNFTRLLSDEAYLNLTGGERAVLHGLWLEYARARGDIRLTTGSVQPDDGFSTTSLSRRLNLRVTKQHLERLNHAGFISFTASKPASSDASKPASADKTREERPYAHTREAKPDRQEQLPNGQVKPGIWHCPLCQPIERVDFKHLRDLEQHLSTFHDKPYGEAAEYLATIGITVA